MHTVEWINRGGRPRRRRTTEFVQAVGIARALARAGHDAHLTTSHGALRTWKAYHRLPSLASE